MRVKYTDKSCIQHTGAEKSQELDFPLSISVFYIIKVFLYYVTLARFYGQPELLIAM